MSKKTQKTTPTPEQQVGLAVADLNVVVRAIEIANKRGAYELAESTTIGQVVARVQAFAQAHSAPAPQEETTEEAPAEKKPAPKKKVAAKKKTAAA